MKEMQHLRQLDSEKCKPHVGSCSNDESPRQERQRQTVSERDRVADGALLRPQPTPFEQRKHIQPSPPHMLDS